MRNFLKQKKHPQFDQLLLNVEWIKKELMEFNQKVPILVSLKAKGFRMRHW